jgi:FkbM family methyltransferase
MMRRLFRLVRYNRDWAKYLWMKRQGQHAHGLVTFRLRNGYKVITTPDARFVLNEIFLDGVYDVPGVDLAKCRSVLDIGANVGMFALYVLSRAPQARVYCFEPSSHTFSVLERNIEANHARIKPFRVAVAGSNGVAHLSLTGNSVEFALAGAGPATERVECVDLQRVFELTGVETFDFVKMDIEGAEREVFAATSDELLTRIHALALEWHHSWDELGLLAERFRSAGFQANRVRLHGHISYLKAVRYLTDTVGRHYPASPRPGGGVDPGVGAPGK